MTTPQLDDKTLRKAWLKQKFGSFEYHEDMLKLHALWLDTIKTAFAKAKQDKRLSAQDEGLINYALPILDRVAKPGTFNKEQFRVGQTFGSAISIKDYDRDSGLETPAAWAWMTEAERKRMYELWGPMSFMAKNIIYTVDDQWTYKGSDDYILDDSYTGPITWPTNWQADVLGVQGQAMLAQPSALRVKGGEPVSQDGTWQALDPKAQRLNLRSGETPPDLNSPYGHTVWQWVGH